MADTKYTVVMKGGGPWGFRLQGGKDFGSPLAISKITPGSKADLANVSPGDYILEINGYSAANMTHFDAQDVVKNANELDILLERREGTKTIAFTETIHSAKSDKKFNAKAKPFGAPAILSQPSQPHTAGTGHTSPAGASTWQPPTVQAKHAPVAASAPSASSVPPASSAPPVPPAPAPPKAVPVAPPVQVSAVPIRAAVDLSDADLAQHFKLNITDNGDVGFAEESSAWGHPPDPKVQSKSFKRLQKHLQEHEDDDLPPPPPEAYDDHDGDHNGDRDGDRDGDSKQIQSRTFRMLQDAVDHGETASSVFDRQKADRSKPSDQSLPKMYRPAPPIIKPASSMPVAPPAPVMSRPGQPQPVALPGMVPMSQPVGSPPKRSPPHKMPSAASPAAVSPTSRTPPGQLEVKRAPAKPPSAQPLEETRTPFCDACGEEVFGPFVSAIGKAWHPDHFVCDGCGESLQNQGFIEEGGKLYCEKDYNKYFAPHCDTCKQPIQGPCVQAVGKTYHPEHFVCSYCGRQIGSEGFKVDRGKPYCQDCYNKLFSVKCTLCKHPIGGGERWVEAMGEPWHATCFKCQRPGCITHLEGKQFYQYGGKPYCVLHGAP